MNTYTTKNGTVYTVEDGIAYPQHGTLNSMRLNASDWGVDLAAAQGVLVDSSLPRDSIKVRSAGEEWSEVYDYLRSVG